MTRTQHRVKFLVCPSPETTWWTDVYSYGHINCALAGQGSANKPAALLDCSTACVTDPLLRRWCRSHKPPSPFTWPLTFPSTGCCRVPGAQAQPPLCLLSLQSTSQSALHSSFAQPGSLAQNRAQALLINHGSSSPGSVNIKPIILNTFNLNSQETEAGVSPNSKPAWSTK